MIKIIMTIISLINNIQNYEKLNNVGYFDNNIFEINYYVEEISDSNLIYSEQIDVQNKKYLYEINPNKYLKEGYFKIPDVKIPLITNEKKNIINIIYQKKDYYINYFYSKEYSLIDIGSKQNANNLFKERKKMQYTDKDPLMIDDSINIENYYKRIKYNYRVEYYYDDVIDNTLSYSRKLYYGTKTRTFEDIDKEGYRLEYTTVDDEPLTITENEDANLIVVHYKKLS